MRHLLIAAVLTLATLLPSQSPSGRHFQRDSRLPETPKASAVKDASSSRAAAPLQKLRSGRAWPKFHYGRLPAEPAQKGVQAVDASVRTTTARRRGFWRAHG